MRDRIAARVVAMVAVPVLALVTVVIVGFVSADLYARLDEIYSSTDGSESQTFYDEVNHLQVLAYGLQQLQGPLVVGAGVAVVVLLALLALRWPLVQQRQSALDTVTDDAVGASDEAVAPSAP